MISRNSVAGWYRNRFVWVAVIVPAVPAGAVTLFDPASPEAEPADLQGQIMTWMRSTLEQADPGQHHHAGHSAQQLATETAKPAVICGVALTEALADSEMANLRRRYAAAANAP